MPAYRKCVNPECRWKGSCLEFFSLEETTDPSHIPPNAKCQCQCFRAQHEKANVCLTVAPGVFYSRKFPIKGPGEDPQPTSSKTSQAAPSAASSSANPSPLHPFINKFAAAATASSAAKDRLDVLNQQRDQTVVHWSDSFVGMAWLGTFMSLILCPPRLLTHRWCA